MAIACRTRSGTLVGPGICRKWRPVCGCGWFRMRRRSNQGAGQSGGRPIRAAGSVSGKRRRDKTGRGRSEEHTSELQSPYDLVCRLLLEKKKKKIQTHKT